VCALPQLPKRGVLSVTLHSSSQQSYNCSKLKSNLIGWNINLENSHCLNFSWKLNLVGCTNFHTCTLRIKLGDPKSSMIKHLWQVASIPPTGWIITVRAVRYGIPQRNAKSQILYRLDSWQMNNMSLLLLKQYATFVLPKPDSFP